MTVKVNGNSSTAQLDNQHTLSNNPTQNTAQNSTLQNAEAMKFLTEKTLANYANTPVSKSDESKKLTVTDFLERVLEKQPIDEKKLSSKYKKLLLELNKSADKNTADDYRKAALKAVFREAGYPNISDEEVTLAAAIMKDKWGLEFKGDDIGNLRSLDKKNKQMSVEAQPIIIKQAQRAIQAVRQYQQHISTQADEAAQKGRDYVNQAFGGFIQPIANGFGNLANGVSEPFRAGERAIFGTNYIPEVPRMQIAERSEYWNKDGRMFANKTGEIAATIAFGLVTGSAVINTQPGRILTGIESAYNIGAGALGKDITQTDQNGEFRQMSWGERALRIGGGLLGARQTIKTEISTPNSIINNPTVNKTADKLNDIFRNNTLKPQVEMVTPEGLRFKVNAEESTFSKPVQSADDLNTKIVTVDSNGNPSGTRFRSDYEDHVKNRDYTKISQKTGVNGCHDMKEFEKFDVAINPILTKDSIKVINKIPHPIVKGIYKIEYQMPALDVTGKPSGLWRYRSNNQLFVKTVYDSAIISDAQMNQWGREAFADAVKNGFTGQKREWTGVASNGLQISGYIDDQGTGAVRTFFSDF